jgi:putative oxidoreductase
MTAKNDFPSHAPTARSEPPPSIVARWMALAPCLLSVLRIVTAFQFMQYGTAKLFAFPGPLLPGGATAALSSLPGIAGILEAFGGFLLLIGLFTRPVAFLLSGQMAIAYWMFHATKGFWPILNHGDPAIFFCFAWLYISSAGPGPWSIDALRQRRSR